MKNNNRDGKYGKIINSIEKNGNLTPQAKNDIIKDVALSMRADMFADSSSVDAVLLKKTILETDNAITLAYKTLKNGTNIGICNHLTNLCLSQRKNLGKYKEMVDLPIQLDNDVDNLLEQCQKFRNCKNEYDGKLQSISEQIKVILDKEFKTRRMSDYKQLRSLATEGIKITKEAEQKHIDIVRLKGMSIFMLEKDIELANEQIKYFDDLNSKNEAQLRALNQKILNAISCSDGEDIEASLNIIRLCNNMKSQIEFLTSKGAEIPKLKYSDLTALDKCIEIEQKNIADEKDRQNRRRDAELKRRQELEKERARQEEEKRKERELRLRERQLELKRRQEEEARRLEEQRAAKEERELRLRERELELKRQQEEEARRREEKLKREREAAEWERIMEQVEQERAEKKQQKAIERELNRVLRKHPILDRKHMKEVLLKEKHNDDALIDLKKRDPESLSRNECFEYISLCEEQKALLEEYSLKLLYGRLGILSRYDIDCIIKTLELVIKKKECGWRYYEAVIWLKY